MKLEEVDNFIKLAAAVDVLLAPSLKTDELNKADLRLRQYLHTFAQASPSSYSLISLLTCL